MVSDDRQLVGDLLSNYQPVSLPSQLGRVTGVTRCLARQPDLASEFCVAGSLSSLPADVPLIKNDSMVHSVEFGRNV